MRETNFIRQNREKWKQFEQILDGQNKDAEKLNELFVQVTDDLSFSRTFYPNRSVRVYLNGLAQRAFSLIYKNRRTHRNRFLHFWTEELPQLMWEARRELALSFGIFALSMLIGALSSAMDSEFVNVILSEEYVEMTKRNIESGDPMAVYKGRGQLSMSMGITVNNLMVAFLTFATGAFFTLGSIVVLIRNGIMVGAFQNFFIERGLFWESFLTIWIHGTLEISAIIIAGAAGITVGKGLVFPGAYRRMQAFQRSARRGLKIMVGIA
ncbi:MAG TPA: stage II sporulation protein M, partial [Saprospiraceae bacterium]|nr:stage II sporulation protein M [Saprospiraceae bacterium]